ncbi:MAG: hypothetical protein IPI67_17635 [Myxococcales bacterium]|nr:hypothetical protein [Myxococcales bacterium]
MWVRFRISATLLGGALALACGSRSGLLDPGLDAGPGGGGDSSGGSPSGGTSSGGNPGGGGPSGGGPSGGSGGVVVGPCTTLTEHPPVLTPDNVPAPALDDGLRLVPTSPDAQQLTAVWVRKNPAGKLTLRHATLSPWSAWPSDGVLGSVHNSGVGTDSSFQLAPAGSGRFSVLVRNGNGPVLHRNLDAFVPGVGPQPVPLPGIDPMFLASPDGAGYLAGTFDVGALGQLLRATRIDAAGNTSELPTLGCASGQAPRSSAVAFGDHWLVGLSRSAGVSGCSATPPAPPSSLDVLAVAKDGSITPLTTYSDGSTIVDVQSAQHPAGLYLVWWASSFTKSIQALRVNANTGETVGPFELFPGALTQQSFAVGSLGTQLIVARRSAFDTLTVDVFDESLTFVSEVSIVASQNIGPSAVFGSPTGESLVVGWTQNVNGAFRVQLTRIDCSP